MSSEPNAFLAALAKGASVGGRAVGTAAKGTRRWAKAAYDSVDPDLRRHLAELPLVGLGLALSGNGRVAPLPDDGFRPIVFVHGLNARPGVFIPLRLFLRLRGRSRTYAVALPGGGGIEQMAEHLAECLREVCEVNALKPGRCLDVVAHSMGGLVARLALEDRRVAKRVHTLVTLGTPHEGTYLARYAGAAPTRELRPDSAVVARLRKQLPWAGPPQQPRLVAFWSQSDVMLLPPTAARVDGAENVELEGFTHHGYLYSPAGLRRIAAALEPEEASTVNKVVSRPRRR